MVAVFLSVTVPIIAISVTRPNIYTASGKILIENSRRVNLELSGQLSEHMEKFAIPQERINSQAEILRSRQLIGQLPKLLNLADSEQEIKKATDRLIRDIEVRVVPLSTTIEVTYSNKDPELASKTVNTLIDLYKQYHLKTLEGDNSADFYRKQLVEVNAALKMDYARLSELRQKAGVQFNYSDEHKTIQDNLQNWRLQLSTLDVRMAEADANLKALKDELAKQPKTLKTLTEMVPNPAVLPLAQHLVALEGERNALLTKFTTESRELKDKLEEIASVKRRIKETPPLVEGKQAFAINPEYQNLEEKVTVARSALEGLKVSRTQLAELVRGAELKLASLQKYSQDLIVAESTLSSHQKSLAGYLGKINDAQFVDSMNKEAITTINVVQTADTLLPERRVLMISIAVAVLLGLMLACVLVFLTEKLRPVLSEMEQVKDLLKLPVLATISQRQS